MESYRVMKTKVGTAIYFAEENTEGAIVQQNWRNKTCSYHNKFIYVTEILGIKQ